MENLGKIYGKIAITLTKFAPKLRARCTVVEYKFGLGLFE